MTDPAERMRRVRDTIAQQHAKLPAHRPDGGLPPVPPQPPSATPPAPRSPKPDPSQGGRGAGAHPVDNPSRAAHEGRVLDAISMVTATLPRHPTK